MNTTSVRHVTPSLGAVLREQFRAVGLAVRMEILIVVALAAGATVLGLIVVQLRPDEIQPATLHPAGDLSLMAAVIGFFFPLLVWKFEKRFAPSHLWTLPVNHQRHAIVKAIAGWGWLVCLLTVALLWLVLVLQLMGAETDFEQMRWVLGDGPPGADTSGPDGTYAVAWTTPAWQWFVPISAASAAYLLGSAIVLATDHPWWWGVGGYLVLGTIAVLVESGPLFAAPFTRLVEALINHPYGVDTLLTSGHETLASWYQPLGAERGVRVWTALPDFRTWAAGALLWTGVALAALGAAVLRHKES